jgi:hypothetical protein
MVDLINSSHLERCASRGIQELDENSKFFLIALNSRNVLPLKISN